MHILIPFAAAPGPQCRKALANLQLPQLRRLLRTLTPTEPLRADAAQLTPVHERVLALAHGIDCPDGLVPWAALDAQRLGLTAVNGKDGWAWITPCHWTVQSNHVDMADPLQLSLTPKEAQALWLAMKPYFAEDGITLFSQPLEHMGTRWLARGKVFEQLPTASLDRVVGRTIDPWTPRQEQAQPLRKLQNEMQMLLYTHPVNDARAKFKLPSINSFWVSGTGALPEHAVQTVPCTVRHELRAPALADDAPAWTQAWQALDESALAQAARLQDKGEPVAISLCGERSAVTLESQPRSLWKQLRQRMSAPDVSEMLAAL